MKSQDVTTPMNEEQWVEIANTISELIPNMSRADAQALIGDKDTFNAGIRRAFEPFIRTKSVSYWLDEMIRFYKEVFDLDCDFTLLRAPVSRQDFNWLLVADRRVTDQAAFEKCVERFTAWKYTDQSLDVAITINDRSEKDGDYAIWLRDCVEADEVHKDKSANDLQTAGIKGITTRERLILELWYEWKNRGQHLDIQNWTLCSGSRGGGGGVPGVGWAPDYRRLHVRWYGSTDRGGGLRCREVVSI